ncbi:MAG: hypothetical protein KDC85_23095 [Saprospiraceae bacterium]|nr:hypothetical protein [Saprospiraceae bacterium]MCB9322864.1 hypothetical protein [Lewinellaceae bacterium]
MSISQRIAKLFEKEKSATDFANKIGISAAGLAALIKKDSNVKSSTLVAILKLYDNPKLNPMWLLLGEGKMWLEPGEEESMGMVDITKEKDEEIYERMNKLLEQRVLTLEREIRKNNPDLADELGIE